MLGLRVVAAALLLALAAVWPAQAAEPLLLVGASVTTGSRVTPALALDIADDTRTWGSWHWQPLAGITVIDRRGDRRDNLEHRVAVGAIGARLTDLPHHLYFSFQMGLAAGRTDAISSGAQFVSTLGWRHGAWVVQVRHISNGRLFHGRNLGETMLMTGWAF